MLGAAAVSDRLTRVRSASIRVSFIARTSMKSVTDDVEQRVGDTINPNTQQESTP